MDEPTKSPNVTLMSLPYDIRHIIYEYLFPTEKQIYIQVVNKGLKAMTSRRSIPTSVLRVCHQLNTETSEHLYNSYLFNVIGRKDEVVRHYESFLHTLEKHARGEVHVDPFSNGDHSATMCMTIHTGQGKVDAVARRKRGLAMRINEIRKQDGYNHSECYSHFLPLTRVHTWRSWRDWGFIAIPALFIAALAYWMGVRQA